MADPVALEVRELSASLGKRDVLTQVSLEARHGEIMAVLGPNGAGKSTLLRALTGIVPYRGHVTLDGAPLETLDIRERATRMSFVPQHSSLSAAMSVQSVVSQGRYAHRRALSRMNASDREAVDRAMHETDVTHLAQRTFTELSFGEQKRVLIARSLTTGARTLLLDEPTASLDIEHALRLFVLLRKLSGQGRCVVVVLHQLDHALKYCDRAALLKDGALLAMGESRSILSAERVRALYGVELVEGGGLGFRLPEEQVS